jgi:hypothetical protein
MSMTVTIIDSIEDELFNVNFQSEPICEFARSNAIFYRPKWVNGTVYQVPTMKHTDLIKGIEEMAL